MGESNKGKTIFNKTEFHSIPAKLKTNNPKNIIAPIMEWVVETGIPILVAITSHAITPKITEIANISLIWDSFNNPWVKTLNKALAKNKARNVPIALKVASKITTSL